MPTTTPCARRRLNGTLAVLALLLALLSALPALSQTVIFQSRLNNAYLALDNRGLLAAIARGPAAQPFELIALQGNRVAFRDPASGRFLRAGVGQATHLALGEAHIRAWETFELVRLGGGDVRLRSVQSGGWVGFDGTGPLTARWGTTGDGQTFRMAPVSMPAPPANTGRPPVDPWYSGTWSVGTLLDRRGALHRFDTPQMDEVRIVIGRDGRIEGYSSCNNFTAEIVEVPGGVRLQNLSSTRRSCPDGRNELQAALYEALGTLHRIGGFQRLHVDLFDDQGQIRARLQPRR
jgi:hypothetical protein